MKICSYLSFLLLFFLLACSEKENTSCTVSIQLTAPKGYTLPFGEVEVVLTNKDQGTVYSSRCSATGLASFDVEQGYYSASAHYKTTIDYRVLIFSGRLESLPLLPANGETAGILELPLSCAKSSALVIKEIYYGGCKGGKGENYIKDQYVTLYNNSEETIYLDSLCVGMVAPSSDAESTWMKYTDMKRVPVMNMAWQFPGNGKDYPLLPGAETTIATNAVDHTGGDYNHPNSVNLSKADWGFWDVSIAARQDITPGVKEMTLVWKYTSLNMYNLSVVGPTFMIFDLPGTTAEAYIANPDNRELDPGNPSNTKTFLMIPAEWIIDCLECVSSKEEEDNKRVPAVLDSGAAYIPGDWYSGQSLIRKQTTTEDGRTVYQDTNNSTVDLEVSVPVLKKK